MILTLRCWLTCKLLTRNLWFMKFVWPGNWTPGPGPESLPSSLTSPSPSLITSLRTFPRVKSLRDLRFNASFHHITHPPARAPLTLHLMTYKIVWDYWNAFQKSKIFCRQIISTKDTQIETNFFTWVTFYQHGHQGIKCIFVKIFFGMFTQYKNAGQLQVCSEVRVEPFSTDVSWKIGNVEMMMSQL